MRVSTALNRLLCLPGASVVDVSFGVEGVIVTVRLRRRRRVCANCGQMGRRLEIHDRRLKRWRHLDLGASRCIIECELRLLRCPDCGVRTEPVPWARPGAQHTRDFDDVVAWLAQQMAKTPIAGLLPIGWDTVGRIVERVMADHLDERRLVGLVAIGVDEISYRRGQRYLTSVADHRTGLLRPKLAAVVVGINPAPVSVAAGHYYQGRAGQALFRRLRSVGLLPEGAGFEDDRAFSAGVGFTDLVKRPTASADELTSQELDYGRGSLAEKLRQARPGLLIFSFKSSATALLGEFPSFGFVGLELAGVEVFVMPRPWEKAELAKPELEALAARVRRSG